MYATPQHYAAGLPAVVGSVPATPGHIMPTSQMPYERSVSVVWQWNLAHQMAVIRSLIDTYRFVAVDCKFPGVIARPMGNFHTTAEYHYQTLRINVDLQSVVQIGLTITDAQGNVPPHTAGTWQFNFKFKPEEHMCGAEGREIFQQSGIDLAKHEKEGIDHFAFAELLLTSGLVLNERITWISFHSGYDLGFLFSLMANTVFPVEHENYMKTLHIFFASLWDVKFLLKRLKLTEKNGLHEIAQDLGFISSGGFFRAGVDSRLAALCFFEVMRIMGENVMRPYKNTLFGLSEDAKEEEEYSLATVPV